MQQKTSMQINAKKHNADRIARAIIQDASMRPNNYEVLVSSVARVIEKDMEVTELLVAARDFIASIDNCGTNGVGLICMIDDQLNKVLK